MSEFVGYWNKPIRICTADLKPKVPFMPLSARKEHPELLPRVNSSLPYDYYFDEMNTVAEEFGREAWSFEFECSESGVQYLERRALLMAEIMNSFNRSRSGRALNVSGCRIQCVRAKNQTYSLRSWSIFRGELETMHVLSRFIGMFTHRSGIEFCINFHTHAKPRHVPVLYEGLWDQAWLSRDDWKVMGCEKISTGNYVLSLYCKCQPKVSHLIRLWDFFEDISSFSVPSLNLNVYRLSKGGRLSFGDYEEGVPFEFLPFRFIPFVRFGDVFRRHRSKYGNISPFKIKRSNVK